MCVHFRLPCLSCPSRCIDPLYFYNLLKSTSTASPRTTTLASLVKGEVLSPEKIRATTGGIAQQPFAPHNPPKPHYPLLCTTTLASLVKGEVLSPEKIRATTGGIASPPSLACTNPSKTALSLSLFVGEWACPSRCTEPLHSHNHCKRTIIPRKSPSPLPFNQRSVGFASVQSLWAFISGFLALLAPPIASNLSIPATIAKGQQPLSPHHHTCLPC